MLYFAKRAIIALAIMLSMSISASAHDFEVDGIYYYITSKSYKTCKVTYEGNIYDEYNNEYYGDIVIPESVTYNGITYSVTCIDEFAFAYCKSLKSVTIPESVTSISSYVFSGCTGLESIIVESGNTIYDSRDNCNAIIATSTNTLITGCKNTTIPNSVTSIGKWAFFGCSGLKSITIPNSVTSIGDDAFYGCSGLTSVTIPDGVTSIGDDAFYGCSGLTSVNIPNSVTSIGSYAFYGCRGLTSVTIPDGVTIIGWATFSGCSGLTSVTIPNGVTSIGSYAFYGCRGLTSVTIPNGVTSIGSYAFYGCRGLTSVTIPNGVTSIGNSAFYNCSGLTSVVFNAENCTTMGSSSYPVFGDCTNLTSITIGDKVKNIPDDAFRDCSGLTSVVFNAENCTTMGSSSYPVFRNCTNLTSITIGDKVKNIPKYAFYGCSSLTSVTIPESVTSIGNGAFSGTGWYNNLPDGVLYLDNCCLGYKGDKPTGELSIKDNTRLIAGSAFSGCSSLTSVTIPNSVTSIGSSAFEYCSGLTKVEITDINSWCKIHFGNETANPLYYAGKLYMDSTLVTDISIENIEEIKPYAFYNLTTLMSLSLDENVSKIGDKAFYGNKNIRSITCKASTPPTCGIDVFNSVKTEAVPLTVPQESVSLYQVADTWMDFWNITGSDFSGIDENLVDDTEGADYYNLQGVKVVNPSSGLYIKKQGNKVTKVIL